MILHPLAPALQPPSLRLGVLGYTKDTKNADGEWEYTEILKHPLLQNLHKTYFTKIKCLPRQNYSPGRGHIFYGCLANF